MTLQDRDKRALIGLGAALALAGVIWIATAPPSAPKVVAARTETVDSAELRLARLRQIAATAPAKQKLLAQAESDLARREKGLIQADTAAQAQAQVVQIVKRIAKNALPPVEISQTELSPPEPFGAYGIVSVAVTFNCRIEQLVNMLADVTAAPELIATDQLRIGNIQPKDKMLPVRLVVAGLVPKKLVPARKALGAF